MDDERLHEILAGVRGSRLVYLPKKDCYLATGNHATVTTAEMTELLQDEFVKRAGRIGPFYKLTAAGMDRLNGRLVPAVGAMGG